MEEPTTDPLAHFKRKQQLICDLVTAVVMLFKTGLFLYGRGGEGKSFIVLSRLKELNAPYVLSNSRMTAKGLFLALKNAPDAIHVLEDMERLTKDPDAQGVLRSVLWSQPGHDRVATWTNGTNGKDQFVFRGGIIMISNRPLSDLPELRALATRIEVHRLDASDAEMEALMRDLAARGYRSTGKLLIEPGECQEVTEYLLAECRRAGCPLDLRLQQRCFQTYLQWEQDHSVCHWTDLVTASVREATHHFRHTADTTPREERQLRRRDVLRDILRRTADVGEQVRLYAQEAGGSRADFFRRKRELDSGEFDPEAAPDGS